MSHPHYQVSGSDWPACNLPQPVPPLTGLLSVWLSARGPFRDTVLSWFSQLHPEDYAFNVAPLRAVSGFNCQSGWTRPGRHSG
jgi:hypothetical protein